MWYNFSIRKFSSEETTLLGLKASFNNFDDVESYCFTEGQMYNQDHCGIVFDPKKM